MRKSSGWTAEDWMGLWLVAMIGGGMFAFRELVIQPFSMVGICAAANAPAICAPRHAVLMLAYHQVWGWAALLLGLAAFVFGKRIAAALGMGLGIAAVVNYDGTTGIIGASLALIAWMSVCTGRYETV